MEIQILISLKEPFSALKSTQLLIINYYLQNEKKLELQNCCQKQLQYGMLYIRGILSSGGVGL